MSLDSRRFFVTGGNLRVDAPCYVPRQADHDLLEGLRRGEFCYVLTSRQMGKSSLMVRTAQRLRTEGAGAAIVDPTGIGHNLTVEQWYDGLLGQVGQHLDLEDELERFWLAHERLGPLVRWMRAIREVVLVQRPGRVVIFVDEIDAVRSLPFSTDEFFAAIRECYNARTTDPELERLTFCLLGVATPSDLIRDVRTTPFNIGRRIELLDFTEAEAAALAAGLGRDPATSARLLQRALHWTGGHPYLTQCLCQAIAEDPAASGRSDVDRLCRTLFLSHRSRERDNNLLFVRERLLRGEADRASLLDLYDQVRRQGAGARVTDDETNPLVSQLRLAGITRVVEGRLCVRNRIYSHVFDPGWVQSNMPGAELRRQRRAFRRGWLRASAVALVVMAVMAGMGVYTWTQYKHAYEADVENNVVKKDRDAAIAAQQAEIKAKQDLQEQRDAAEKAEHLAAQRAVELALTNGAQLQDPNREWNMAGSLVWFQEALLYDKNDKNDPEREKVDRLRLTATLAACPHLARLWFTDGPAGCAEFSPDGRKVVGVSTGKRASAIVWDLQTGKRLAKVQPLPEGAAKIHFGPDGRWLWADVGGKGRVWDAVTGAEREGPWSKAAICFFSPDGARVLALDADKTAELWDVGTGKTVGGPLPAKTSYSVFSPDGGRLLTVSADGSARAWDAATAKPAGKAFSCGSEVYYAAFSQDGKLVVTFTKDMAIVWDLETSTDRGREDVRQRVEWASFARGNRYFLTLDKSWYAPPEAPAGPLKPSYRDDMFSDRGIQVYDSQSGKLSQWLRPNGLVRRFAPGGGRWLVTSGEGGTRVFDLDPHDTTPDDLPVTDPTDAAADYRKALALRPGNRPIPDPTDPDSPAPDTDPRFSRDRFPAADLNTSDAVNAIGFSPDGRYVATAGSNGTVRVWTAAAPGNPVVPALCHIGKATSVCFSPDGRQVLTAGEDGTIRLWDLGTGGRLHAAVEDSRQPRHAAFSDDGRRFVLVNGDGSVRVWETATSRSWLVPVALGDAVSKAWLSPDGRLVAVFNDDGSKGQVWDVESGQRKCDLAVKGEGAGSCRLIAEAGRDEITQCTFSRDGGRLFALMRSGRARVWDVENGQPQAAVLDQRVISTAVWGPAGELAAAEDKDILLFQPKDAEPMVLRKHAARVTALAFSRDGRRLLSGSEDGAALVWDATTGQAVQTLSHDREVTCVAFSSDGGLAVVGGKDGVARVWDVKGCVIVAELGQRGSEVTQVVFEATDPIVAVACADHTVQVWDARTGDPISPPLAHAQAVKAACFGADGKWLATLDALSRVRRWDLAGESLSKDDLPRLIRLLSGGKAPNRGSRPAPLEADKIADDWPRDANAMPASDRGRNWDWEEAEKCEEEGNTSGALRHYNQLAREQEHPSSALLARIGDVYFQTGDLDTALRNYEAAEKAEPRDRSLPWNVASVYLARADAARDAWWNAHVSDRAGFAASVVGLGSTPLAAIGASLPPASEATQGVLRCYQACEQQMMEQGGPGDDPSLGSDFKVRLIHSYLDFSAELVNVGDPAAQRFEDKVEALLDSQALGAGSPRVAGEVLDLRVELTKKYVQMAVADVKGPDAAEARQCFEHCRKLMGRPPQGADPLDRWKKGLIDAHIDLVTGLISTATEPAVARAYCASALDSLATAPEVNDRVPDFKRRVAEAWKKFGDDRLEAKRAGMARDTYKEALALWDSFVVAVPDDDADRSDLYFLLTKLAEATRQTTPAARTERLGYLQRAREIIEARAAAAPEDDAHKVNVGYVLERIGSLYLEQDDFENAETWYRKELDHDQAWVDHDSASDKAKRDLVYSLGDMAVIREKRGDSEGALQYRRRIVKLCEELLKANPEDEDVVKAALDGYEQVGMHAPDPAEARSAWRKVLDLSKTRLKDHPSDGEAKHLAGAACEYLADEELQLGDQSAAYDYAHQAVAFYQAHLDDDKGNSIAKRALSYGCEWLSRVAFAIGRTAEARESIEEAVKLREALVNAPAPDSDPEADRAQGYWERADLSLRLGDATPARQDFDDALGIRKKLAAEDPKNAEKQRYLATTYNSVGDAQLELGDLAAARDAYQQALDLARARAEKPSDAVEQQTDLASDYGQFGYLELKAGNFAKAEKWYTQEAVILEKLDADNKLDTPSQKKMLCDAARNRRVCKGAKEALADLQFARGRPSRQEAADLLLFRAAALARKGDAKGALEAAHALRDLAPADAENLFDLARCYARMVREIARGRPKDQLTPDERTLWTTCADAAVEALTKAVAAGYQDGSVLFADRYLDAIRPVPGYQDVVQAFKGREHP